MLATMTRPEGAIGAAVFLGLPWCGAALAALRRPPGGRMAAIASVSFPAVAFGMFIVALTAFRIWYYGDPLPNTFYAKVGDIPLADGLIYVRNFLVDGPGLLLAGVAAAAVLVPATRLALAYAAIMTVYVVSIGGDVFQNGRFMLPLLPIMAGAAIAGACAVLARNRIGGWCLLSLLPACCLCSLFAFWPASWGRHDTDYNFSQARPGTLSAKRNGAKQHYVYPEDRDDYQIAFAAKLSALQPKVHMIATVGVGRLGYYSEDVMVLDLVGLLDRHIARSTKTLPGTDIIPGHSRTDAAYVLSRHPDIIQIPRKGIWGGPRLPALVDLWNNPDLDRLYSYSPEWGYVRR
jgi:hypothetical protein